MEQVRYDAFLSYAHRDNARRGEPVLSLAHQLADEYADITGDELELFVDRESIEWGAAWQATIADALGSAPFFIAIVTPSYVISPACRDELLAFHAEAESRGFGRLILPILFIDVPGLSVDSDDKVLSILARAQYEQWTALRLLDPVDTRVRTAVNKLAAVLSARRDEVTSWAADLDATVISSPVDSMSEVVDQIDQRLALWMESVEFDQVATAQWESFTKERTGRVSRLRSARQPAGAVLSVIQKLGRDLLPIAQNRLEKAKNYARLTIELDPFVTSLVRLVRLNPSFASVLDPIRDGVTEAYLNITPSLVAGGGYQMSSEFEQLSAAVAKANQIVLSSEQFVLEGNKVVERWRENLIELDRDSEGETVAVAPEDANPRSD